MLKKFAQILLVAIGILVFTSSSVQAGPAEDFLNRGCGLVISGECKPDPALSRTYPQYATCSFTFAGGYTTCCKYEGLETSIQGVQRCVQSLNSFCADSYGQAYLQNPEQCQMENNPPVPPAPPPAQPPAPPPAGPGSSIGQASSLLGSLSPVKTDFQNPDTLVGAILSQALPYTIVFAGMILVVFIVMGGYQMLMSPTNPQAQEAGKNKIMWSIIGFLVVFSAYWVMQIIQVLFGFNVLGGTSSTPPSIPVATSISVNTAGACTCVGVAGGTCRNSASTLYCCSRTAQSSPCL